MRIIRPSQAVQLLLALALLGAGSYTPGQVALLRVGTFHGNEVPEEPGPGWFGLFATESGFELRPTKVAVTAAVDVISDGPGEKTGRAVTIDGRGTPLVLVRGIPALKERPVEVAIAKPRFFYPGERVPLKLTGFGSERAYALTAYGNADRPPDSQAGTPRLYGYRLVLTADPWTDENQQVLIDLHGLSEDKPPSIVWAGDLDGDGGLDLLMEVGNHYNVTEYALLLTSATHGTGLVREVARFRSVGC